MFLWIRVDKCGLCRAKRGGEEAQDYFLRGCFRWRRSKSF